MVEFSKFDRACHPRLPLLAFKTACDVDELNEQISGQAELEEDEETCLGPWLGHVGTDALPKRRCDSD